nr:histidine ammonia-lyase [Saprospiraceae bacterium]
MEEFYIGSKDLSWGDIQFILYKSPNLKLDDEAREKIAASRDFLDNKLTASDQAYYGINTGFGALHNVKIPNEDLAQLQENLVMSHACGMGTEAPADIVRLMLAFKALGLSKGYSGVAVETVEKLLELHNKEILPVVYELGSLGASGDLAPLAHLSLPLIGKGQVWSQGTVFSTETVFSIAGIEPLTLKSKEGLALLNGTQFMSAYGAYCVLLAKRLLKLASFTAACSIDAFGGRIDPFDKRIHQIRRHKGQQVISKQILDYLEGSILAYSDKDHVQDPYSFRCIPQVHGASWDCVNYVSDVIHTEINAVTDNPNIFPEEGDIISGGNFHGQPLALPLDYLAMSMAEIASISEKRIYKLLEGQHGLPPFLVANPGLNSGFMIPQYVAGAIVSQNKQFCTPSSIDNIVSCNGQEDHVSMGANAATKCLRVLDNVERVIAIEFMTAMQGLDFRDLPSSDVIEEVKKEYRETVPTVDNDR